MTSHGRLKLSALVPSFVSKLLRSGGSLDDNTEAHEQPDGVGKLAAVFRIS